MNQGEPAGGSRIQVPIWLVANLGYRFYAHHLRDFYNCDWFIGQLQPQRQLQEAAAG